MGSKVRVPAWATKPMRPFAEIVQRRRKIWTWVAVPLCLVGMVLIVTAHSYLAAILGLGALTRATYWIGIRNGLRHRDH